MDVANTSASKAAEGSPLLTTDEAAAFLRVSAQTLRNDRVTKRLKVPVRRLGRLIRYHKRDLELWLDQQLVSEVA